MATDIMPRQKLSFPQIIGLILCRAVVPLWVITGAIFKLTEKSPRLLPESIWSTAAELGINLYWLLAVLIAIELTLAGIMFFLSRLARPAAILILCIFCLVLIVEIARGSKSCGCLGAASPPPWLMLIIDGALLLGVLAFRPPKPATSELMPSGPATVTAIWILGALSVTAAMILPETRPNTAIIPPQAADDGAPDDGTAAGDTESQTAKPKPQQSRRTIPSLVIPKSDEWVGRQWSNVEFSGYVTGWPDDLDHGRQYVIFYSRSCDHCQSLLNYFFYDPPVRTTIVAVPETKSGFNVENELPMNCPGCVELELPVGTEWLFTPPIVVALEDGVVKCAAEAVDPDVENPQCLLWHTTP